MPLLAGVDRGHPEGRGRDHEPEHHQHASRTAMPPRVASADPGGELEGAEDGEPGGGDDVRDERVGRGGEARVRRQQLRPAEHLDEASGAGHDRHDGEGHQAGRHPPARPAPPARCRGAAPDGQLAGGGRRGHSTPAEATTGLGALAGRCRPGARDPPQRVAEADQGDAVREGQQPVGAVGQQRERGGDDRGDREQCGRPAGQDAGPVERDAEDQAAGQVPRPPAP